MCKADRIDGAKDKAAFGGERVDSQKLRDLAPLIRRLSINSLMQLSGRRWFRVA